MESVVPVYSSPLDVPRYLCRFFTAYILEYTDKCVHTLGHIVPVTEEPSGNFNCRIVLKLVAVFH